MLHHKFFCICIALCFTFYAKAQVEYDLVFDGNASVGSSWIYIDQNSDYVFFAVSSSANGRELWKSDGTVSGTVIIKDIHTSGSGMPNQPVGLVVNDVLYFAANEGVSTGQELWKSDGTEAGTVLVKDIYSGNNFGFDSEYIVEFDGGVAFTGQDEDGEELWISDGTEGGTVQVKDIKVGATGSLVRYIANANGTLYFIAAEASEFGLWKSDGTEGGTTKLSDLGTDANPEYVTFHQGNILFYNWTASDVTKDEVWISDGTIAGTEKLTDILTSGPINDPMVASGNNLFFRAADDDAGIELYKTDGTAPGTGLVKDLDEGAGDSFPENFIDYMGEIYFVAESHLWKSDGTDEGTLVVVPDVNNRTEILSDGSNLYYRIDNNLGIYNPNDGASVITTAPDFYVHDLKTIFNGELYFIGSDDIEDEYDLWKYNLSDKMDQTITFDPLADVTFGDPNFELEATTTSSLQIAYLSSDEDIVSISGSTVSINGAGSCNITASQAGNDNYNPADDVIQTLTVNKAAQTITFDPLPIKDIDDDSFVLTATASSNLEVTYTSSATSVATVTSDGVVTIAGEGSTTLTAAQIGNENYLAAEDVEQVLTVIDALGVDEIRDVLIYPNPSSNLVVIEVLNNSAPLTFELIDSAGRLLQSKSTIGSSLSFDLGKLKHGIYFIRLQETSRTFKIIKVY
ncbi:T9SS type A sorting domain-containing protein [Ekhidna sp.]|jgi:ELWxxDGT repeat protein|uniref:T9SS type A sorting domain-containing protein n=1 Tax=Ekhidna sp. TaxID=2608089 RepID=UPI0032ED4359